MIRLKRTFVLAGLLAALLAHSHSACATEIVIAGGGGASQIAVGHAALTARGSDDLTGGGRITFKTEIFGTHVWRFDIDSGGVVGSQVFLEGHLTSPDDLLGIEVFVLADAETEEFEIYGVFSPTYTYLLMSGTGIVHVHS
jgi:hypothetical protein